MSLHTRLHAVQRERGRRCSACGGPVQSRRERLTLDEVIEAARQLTDLEKIELYRRSGREDLIPARLQELAARLEVSP